VQLKESKVKPELVAHGGCCRQTTETKFSEKREAVILTMSQAYRDAIPPEVLYAIHNDTRSYVQS